MNQYLDLRQFRKVNNLTQEELAVFLGTSKAFISQVETNKSHFPNEHLKKLLYEGEWDLSTLVPSFIRFLKIWKEYNKQNGIEQPFDPLKDQNPFSVSVSVVESLLCGKILIDNAIADSIRAVIPSVNKEWLINGEGEMFNTCNPGKDERIEMLEKKVNELARKVDELTKIKDAFEKIKHALNI